MPRKQYSYHYIYKTTCLITNKFYYGMHSTFDLEDGYAGSGTHIWRSIKKYGKENHKVEILEFLEDRESLRKREAEIINEDLLKDPLCMNIKKGGNNDFFHENHPSFGKKRTVSEETKKKISESISKLQTGRKASDKSRKANSEAKKGRKRPDMNFCRWVHNDICNKRIHVDELDEYLNNGWSRGTKRKFYGK